jgi:hypothetical protein
MCHVPCDEIVKIKQELFGNGGPGLAADFKEMYKEFQQWKGAFFQQKTSNIVTKKKTKSFNIGHFTP